jgi:squalene-hopene/tetraprenyl-beta-curcumene cyclase
MTVDRDHLRRAYKTARDLLLAERIDGHWVGELSASALSTATAVSALSLVSRERQRAEKAGENAELGARNAELGKLIEGGVTYLIEHQNDDGGWGDTDKSYSNIATTYLCVAALHLSNRTGDFAVQVQRAEEYIKSNGSIDGLKKRYGVDRTFVVPILTNCALAGLVPWSAVDALPFELAVVPQRWYRFVGMPVVSYAIPALVAIGQAKFFHSPPWNPLTRLVRSLSIARSLKVLRQMQPASGGYLEAVPLTSFVVMSLASTQSSHHAPRDEAAQRRSESADGASTAGQAASAERRRVVTRSVTATILDAGIQFLINSARPDGSWPIDTNLATWVTTLSLNALAGAGEDITQYADLDWLLKCQHTQRHPFTGADPGGWGWSDLSGAVPDADDTPGAMISLFDYAIDWNVRIDDSNKSADVEAKNRLDDACTSGLRWLRGLQNRDGGWPTFCRGWGKLPFDRSGVDLTAHVIRAFASPWGTYREQNGGFVESFDELTNSGFRFIERHQRPDGSWVPLWFGNQDHPDEENPIYGTAKVLMAYRDTGRTETPAAQRGFDYLVRSQNADGGWGGGASVRNKGIKLGDQVIESTVEETALAVEALLGKRGARSAELGMNEAGNSIPRSEFRAPSSPPRSPVPDPQSPDLDRAITRGLAWLCAAVDNGRLFDPAPIGFYFAKLWYYERLYPLIFTVSALGRAVRQFPIPAEPV